MHKPTAKRITNGMYLVNEKTREKKKKEEATALSNLRARGKRSAVYTTRLLMP
jgi:hypothetical protein